MIPYFRPEALEPSAWPKHMTSCYGTYTVVGVNTRREMVLSPNDEEVANSSQKHTQLKTRVRKPYPITDQNGRNWYPISDQNGWKNIPFGTAHTCTNIAYVRDYPPPLGVENALQIMSLAAYASGTKIKLANFCTTGVWHVNISLNVSLICFCCCLKQLLIEHDYSAIQNGCKTTQSTLTTTTSRKPPPCQRILCKYFLYH